MFEPTNRKDLLRFDLTLLQDDGPGVISTFTWGETYQDAYNRVVDTLDSEDDLWDGWSFKLHNNGRKV